MVEEELAGCGDRLKEYVLGVGVFGRPADFDPRIDSLVRVEARRLRAALEKYYADKGRRDPIIIELQKGAYLPSFHRSAQSDGLHDVSSSSEEDGNLSPSIRELATAPHKNWKWAVLLTVALGGVLGIVVAGFLLRSRRALALTERDSIVLSEFANSTGDPTFDDALKQGLTMALEQSPFLNLNGPAVFHATGLHASMGSNTIMIGQWVANPNSATLTAEYASNDSGNSIPLNNFTATYSIAVNGRANLIPSTGGVPTFYYYLVGPNQAFLVSDDQNVMTGMVEPQTIPSGGFTNASMLGDYFLGTIDRASAGVIDASGVENLDGANTWTSMEDASMPSGNYSDLPQREPTASPTPPQGGEQLPCRARMALCSMPSRQVSSTTSFSTRPTESQSASSSNRKQTE